MKAQKTCPLCKTAVHARKSKCDCGHVFYETKAKPEVKPKAEGPGPGRKQCANCHQFSGVRSAVCVHCGTEFVKRIPVAENPATIRSNPAKVEAQDGNKKVFKIIGGTGNTNLNVCIAPAGKCPVEIKDWTKEGLYEWAGKVQEAEAKKGYVLANEALAYFARQFYSFWKDTDKETLVKETFPVDKEGI
jgi:hypothetical protein